MPDSSLQVTGTPAAIAREAADEAAVVLERASLGISIDGIVKRYGSATALAGVSLDIAAGEFLTLLGPSGSGKTTLLNIIAGFLEPDAGALRFGGQDVTLLPVNRRGLGMVFQNYALFPHMTVGENVAFPLKVRRLGRAEIARRVRVVLDMVKLGALADRNVGALSGGQRQRVALARAIVFSPKIVLMDEPLSALDKNLREEMQVEIRRLHGRIGATTIYVTHDQREALTISDRIAVMDRGRIVQCDTPRKIYEQPRTVFVAGFIGETTILPVERAGSGVRLPDGTLLQPRTPLPAARRLALALRAEQIRLPDECGADACRFGVTAREVIYQGDSLLILTTVDGTAGDAGNGGAVLAIRRPPHSMGIVPRAGDRLTVGIDPAAIVILPLAEEVEP